ncbi:hypothetical protein FCM35_KLT05567 [Carex littledalei]|uniref:Ubiquitin-like protease family profile domain-containing protein n=1 Tax=Carex littledalei TaxID=544730 RepID=A0A833V9W4_9POAL|nr:hypothetical protein FCM35_KLT05567 [Carex littledalei]
MYEYREKLSYDVTNILDDWWVEVQQKKLVDQYFSFEHKLARHGFCRVQFIRDLMLPEHDVSSELLELVLQVMQLETPVRYPWFFISPYIISIMHMYDYETALKNISQLFSDQFEKIKWLFVPMCAKEHWVLAIFDLKCKKVLYYTSAGENNLAYIRNMIMFLHNDCYVFTGFTVYIHRIMVMCLQDMVMCLQDYTVNR